MRDAYPFWHAETLRFSDTDMMGHVNNVAFASLFESARSRFFLARGLAFAWETHLLVAARIEIDFLAELLWPGEIELGTRVDRVGNTSITLEQALLNADRPAARARTVIVVIDRATRRPAAVPAELRAKLF